VSFLRVGCTRAGGARQWLMRFATVILTSLAAPALASPIESGAVRVIDGDTI
jgi:hypothetical protein